MLELKGIKKDYNLSDITVKALKSIDLKFGKTEFCAILGPSGCGKTTLLNIIGGLDSYTNGDLLIDGISTKNFKSRDWDTYRNKKIGFIFQSYNLIPHITVLANVEMALTISGVSKKEKRQLALSALDKVGLSEQINKKPMQMSGGQMQRVAIARAIVNNPDIILADEPTGALDSVTSVQVLDILKEIAKERLVIMVTHNAELASHYCTRIIRLLDGEIISDNGPDSLNKSEIATHESNETMLCETNKNLNNVPIVDMPIADHLGANNDKYNDRQYSKLNNDGTELFSDKTNEESKDKIKKLKKSSYKKDIKIDDFDDKELNQNNKENIKFKKDKHLKVKQKRDKKASMSFFTALALSFQNLITKKLRTFLTIFAGSIGIIGIALVLSISNGFSLYMANLERTTLSSFPITISEIAFSYNMSESAEVDKGTFPSDKQVTPFSPTGQAGLKIYNNRLTKEYIDYIDKMQEDNPDWAASISYERLVKMNLISKKADGSYALVDNATSDANKYIWWQELLNDSFVDDYYEIIDGHYPKNKNEIVLIVDNKNKIRTEFFNAIGYNVTPKADGTYNPIKFSDIIGKEFKLLLNDEYYSLSDGVFTAMPQSNYASAYESKDNKLKIVGVMRIKKDSDLDFFSGGIGYTTALTDYVLENAKDSQIVTAQKENFIDVLSATNDEFEFVFTDVDKLIILNGSNTLQVANLLKKTNPSFSDMDISSINETSSFADLFTLIKAHTLSTQNAVNTIWQMLSNYISKDTLLSSICPQYTQRLQEIGATAMPKSISIYPSSYEAKKNILNYLDTFNEGKEETNQIHYTDLASTITNNMAEMIDIVSYVLIAFAAISLIVSSIMIAIITYISVLERTKEIGVLRSLGARKIDISNLFNAETFIIGASSGTFGVIVAAILNFPINAIINKLSGGIANNIAKLAPLHGFLLVLLSIILTVISGLIPAIIAAKKDPVVALRTN